MGQTYKTKCSQTRNKMLPKSYLGKKEQKPMVRNR